MECCVDSASGDFVNCSCLNVQKVEEKHRVQVSDSFSTTQHNIKVT